ncbi:PHP domain-containing protein [Virgibacillus xinjiangensis]|uniref:PHP domain-containing protein n=1 Tax=Virgibacillus xinjiangensis TaxID=393090 RepID=A0ABV7CWW9_9BACI
MDLHIHSIYSDGHWSPEQIIQTAKRKNIGVLSITDHDSIEGYKHGKPMAEREGIHLIPGIELNTDGELGELHILGYLFDPEHPGMKAHITWRQEERVRWGKKIIENLHTLQYSISMEACMARAGKGVLVRTHIADELAAVGYFSTGEEAYNTLLRKGKAAYAERAPFSAAAAIQLIHAAGGLAFLAHPGIYGFDVPLEDLIAQGLDGIEVYHSKHTKQEGEKWKTWAEANQLLVSGGSDFHGPASRNPYPIGSVSIGEEVDLMEWERRVLTI